MHSVVGIFPTREAAHKAAKVLNLPEDRVSVVAPDPLKPEDEGIGSALGGAVGGAIGAATGSTLGTVAGSLLLPGVGPVIATGVIAAVVLGAGGAVAGAAAGEKVEDAAGMDPNHNPRDVFFYHEALRRGRAVVLALADTAQEAGTLRSKLAAQGGEGLDVFRESWWQGLREQERSGYAGDFVRDERDFRNGFEAAIEPANRERPLDEAEDLPEAYRKGYRRGYEYVRKLS